MGYMSSENIENEALLRELAVRADDSCRMLNNKQVCSILAVGSDKARLVIMQLNRELKDAGKATVRGKVPFAYLAYRYAMTTESILDTLTAAQRER